MKWLLSVKLQLYCRVQSFYSFCQNIDLSSLQLALTEKNSQLPDLSCCGLPAVLGDPDPDVRYIIVYNSYHRFPEVTFINNIQVKGIRLHVDIFYCTSWMLQLFNCTGI